ncbi:MAG TPA: MFS transporter [Pseudonocardiaceae bacterium]|nr:MFS transporter [Pseudonocardiaceae bacterium]
MHMPSGVTASAGRREWIGLAVLALPTLLTALDISVVYLAVPRLSADLGPSPTQQLWIADIYGFLLAGFLIPMGTLGDRIGRRRLLLIGACAFGCASLLAAFSQNGTMLIVARALLGVAGATLAPSTLALITTMFRNPGERGRALAIWVSCLMAGTALGPLIGGVLLHFFWWGSVFLLGSPAMLVLLITGRIFLPEHRNPNPARIDAPSVVLSVSAILLVIYGVKELAANGVTGPAVAAVAVGLALGVAFVRRQHALADPLVDLRLFATPSFRVATVSLLLNSVAMSGVALLVNQYLQVVRGLSPLSTGVLLVAPSLAVVGSAMAAPRLAQRFRPAHVITAGTTVTAVGCFLLTRVGPAGPVLLVEFGYLLGMLGVGPMVALGTDLIVGRARPEQAGAVGAVKETADNLGFALGAALLGSIATAVYRHTPGAPADSIAEVSPHADPAVLAVARSAFTSGFDIAAGTATGIAVVVVALVLVTLRKIPPTGGDGDADARQGSADGVGDQIT